MNTRPTSDKIKESIFNILPPDFDEKRILDLFAGTGNMGIEALSRGAMTAVFVENDRTALLVLEKNIRNCRFFHKSQIVGSTVAKGIRILEKRGDKFNFIFLDPPYGRSIVGDTLERVSRSDILGDNTLVVAEHSFGETVEDVVGSLTITDQRRYGKTLVSFFVHRRIEGQNPQS